jgi:hypothetical protein
MPTYEFETTVKVEADFEVYCGNCNEGLCLQSTFRKSYHRGENQLVVDPCKKCLKESLEEGNKDEQLLIDEIDALKEELRLLKEGVPVND